MKEKLLKRLEKMRKEKKLLIDKIKSFEDEDEDAFEVLPKRKKKKTNSESKMANVVRSAPINVVLGVDDFDDDVYLSMKVPDAYNSKKRKSTKAHGEPKRRKIVQNASAELFSQAHHDSMHKNVPACIDLTEDQNQGVVGLKRRKTRTGSSSKRVGRSPFDIAMEQGVPTVSDKKCSASEQWNFKYMPQNISELEKGVNKKKVEEVKGWLTSAFGRGKNNTNVLILYGPPGIGKSTMIRVIAKEMNIELREWKDSESDGSLGYHEWQRKMTFMKATGVNRHEQTVAPRVSQVDDLKRFLFRSKQLAPLRLVSTGMNRMKISSNASSAFSRSSSSNSLILLESLPSPGKSDSFESLHAVLQQFLKISNQNTKKTSPMVVVFSGRSGGAPSPAELAKVFSAQFLESELVHQVQCRPVPPTSLRRVLTMICKTEKLPASFQGKRKGRGKGQRAGSHSPLDSIVERSNGDLRHAIISLQFIATGIRKDVFTANMTEPTTSNTDVDRSNTTGKDDFIDLLHNIGKLLYAKRIPCSAGALPNEQAKLSRLPLKDNPDHVVRRIGMDPSMLGAFVSQNAPSFYTDISELSEMMSALSDADVLGTYENDRKSLSKTSTAVTSSMALIGRAVSHTNIHPAPNSYRQIVRPQVLGVVKNSKENKEKLRAALPGRLVNSSLCTQIIPYIALINSQQHSGCNSDAVVSLSGQSASFKNDEYYGRRIGTFNDNGKSVGAWS